MIQDLRVAWRFLLRSPATTTLAVVTLGATVAICSLGIGLLDENLWRPLAFQRGGQLVTVYNSRPAAPQFQTLSYPDYADLRAGVEDAVDLAAFVRVFHTVNSGGIPGRLQGELVSGNYFSVLDVKPFLGRLLTPDDDRIPGGHAVVVLGHELWRRTFASDPSAIGRIVTLNRREYTIVGVAPPGFHGPAYRSEFWIPLMMAQQSFGGLDVLGRKDVPFLQTVGRARSNGAVAELRARVQSLATSATPGGWRLTALPAVYLRIWPAYRSTVARFLGIFAALGACVLLIGCANLAGLLLARSAERQRDLSIRQALGATRGRLFRRLLAESLVLTLPGAAIGLGLTAMAARLASRVPLPVPVQIGVTPDARLAATSLGVSLLGALLFTVVFALKAPRADTRGMLASSSQAASPRTGAQRALVIVQVAISCVTVTAAGLLARSALAVDRIDTGFNADGAVSGLIALNDRGYTPAGNAAFYERLQQDLESQPSVDAVALEWHPALGAVRATARATVRGLGPLETRYNVVGPGYFGALRIALLAGREFEPADRQGAEPVAVVNETLAGRIGSDAVGRTLTLAGDPAPRRIVGVVRDVKYNAITEPAQPFVYLPLAQAVRPEIWVHLRTRTAGAEALLRERLRLLDSDVPLSDLHTLREQLDAARATPRIAARMSGGMALLATFLALVGLYGLLAASVAQRRRELAIRTALGASPAHVLAHVAFDGVRLTTVGLATGMLASLAASSVLAALLYGIQPRDPLVFAVAPILILVASMPAWFLPARRAARANPIDALKQS